MPLKFTRIESLLVPATHRNLALLVWVVREVPRVDLFLQLARLAKRLKKWSDALLCKIRVRHADYRVVARLKHVLISLNYKTKSPV